MKILALDAATEACSAALQFDGEVIHRFEVAPQQHSQKLLPFVDELLAEAGIKLQQLDGLAYGQGPGSFTGVRIGVAITQGLAFGADLPVVGVSSLATMAQQVISENSAEQVVTAIDARMAEIYLGYYRNQNGLATLMEQERVLKPDEIQPLQQMTAKAFSAGTGWVTYPEVLSAKFAISDGQVELPNAKFMLPLAEALFSANASTDAEHAQPNYVRDEVSWQKLPGR